MTAPPGDELLRAFDALPVVFAYVDANERYVYANRAYAERYGRPDPLVGRSVRDAVGDALYARIAPFIRRALAGETVTFESDVARADGATIGVVATYVPDFGPDGRVRGFSAMSEDVTARRRVERAQRFLADAGRLFASSLDYAETLARAANLAVPELGDFAFVDLLCDDGASLERVAVAHRDPDLADLARALKRRYPLESDAPGIGRAIASGEAQLARDGDAASWTALARDEHLAAMGRAAIRSYAVAPLVVRGRTLGALTLASCSRSLDELDAWVVTEIARQAGAAIDNARLFAAERRARDRVTRMQQVTAALSRARTVDEVAEATCRLGSEASGATSGAMWLADDDATLHLAGMWGTDAAFMDAFRTIKEGDERYPAARVLKAGVPLWVETDRDYQRETAAVHQTARAAGRVVAWGALPIPIGRRTAGVLVFGHPLGHRYDEDERAFYVTLAQECAQALERALLYDEARAAKEEAERASRVKDEFLAMLGHELRNPLAPIVTALHRMSDKGAPFERERQVIARQVRHLGRLVDDLLDVSRIARGRIELVPQVIDLADVIDRAVETVRPLLEERRHVVDVKTERGLAVEGDATRLAQVITNLLTNAARYTPPGGHVAIEARRDGAEIVARVKDDGSGIAPDLLPRVFDLFAQGAQAAHRPEGGLGLGLAIVKSLVTLHKGSVVARSEGAGRGAELEVRLPAASGRPSSIETPTRDPRAPGKASVIVVDDNADAAEMLAVALSDFGYDTRTALDGRSALALIEERAPDVAVLDLGLPEMDGFELARRVRAIASGTKLVALTGYGQARDRLRTRDAGFDEHLVKPVDLERLHRVLEGLIGI